MMGYRCLHLAATENVSQLVFLRERFDEGVKIGDTVRTGITKMKYGLHEEFHVLKANLSSLACVVEMVRMRRLLRRVGPA